MEINGGIGQHPTLKSQRWGAQAMKVGNYGRNAADACFERWDRAKVKPALLPGMFVDNTAVRYSDYGSSDREIFMNALGYAEQLHRRVSSLGLLSTKPKDSLSRMDLVDAIQGMPDELKSPLNKLFRVLDFNRNRQIDVEEQAAFTLFRDNPSDTLAATLERIALTQPDILGKMAKWLSRVQKQKMTPEALRKVLLETALQTRRDIHSRLDGKITPKEQWLANLAMKVAPAFVTATLKHLAGQHDLVPRAGKEHAWYPGAEY